MTPTRPTFAHPTLWTVVMDPIAGVIARGTNPSDAYAFSIVNGGRVVPPLTLVKDKP